MKSSSLAKLSKIPFPLLNFCYRIFNLPMIGDIKDRFITPTMRINDRRFGKSFSMPSVLGIVIDGKKSMPANVGEKVNDVFFFFFPRLKFNVCFSCGKSGFFNKGVYTDPESIWFNVFFGYYEIDVVKSEWKRPFGYNLKNALPEINFYDLARIGKSDWNYFSNYLYGVPEQFIKPTNPIILEKMNVRNRGRVRIGTKFWDWVEVGTMNVVSAYTAPGEVYLLENPSIFSPVWRKCFGNPCPSEDFTTSFIPVDMKAGFYLCYTEEKSDYLDLKGEIIYKTYIFGGTINRLYDKKDAQLNENFLEAQLESAQKLISKSFSDIGFGR